MATRTQVKALIDSLATQVKTDIDNTLPAGVNIVGGDLTPSPAGWVITMDSGANINDAVTLVNTITTNLTNQSRTYSITYNRRTADGTKNIAVIASPAVYRIIGFTF